MAKVNTTERFIDLVQRSELISKEDFAAFLAQRVGKAGGVIDGDPVPLAQECVTQGLLTEWQVEQLLKGKYRGFKLGKYTLKGHLGTGGMSSVYLSEHPIMRRPVAIKVLPKARVAKSSYLERFELEARAVAALDHPNIVRAYDIDNEADTHYIVMEYVEGKDLQRMVEQEGPLPYERAAEYIAQAAVGLQHAHEAGVVHRDIKPANCLVDKSGTVKVLDMGLAKFTADEHSLSAVHKDSVVGTADYLAPEQAVNSSTVDSRADVYGLGGTLYFLLTGHPPFPEGTLTERLLKHQREEPRSIFEDRPDAPPTLVDICRRMMAKKPDRRIATAADVAIELRQWLTSRGYGPTSPRYGATAGPSRIPRGTGGAGVATSQDRWQQLAAKSTTRPADRAASDTVSATGSDTARIVRDEDLTLAPIEDDVRPVHEAAGQSDVTNVSTSDVDVSEQAISQIEEELGGSSTSGSLVDLLHEKNLSSVSTSGVILRRRRSEVSTGAIIGSIVGGVVLVIVVIVLLVVLF